MREYIFYPCRADGVGLSIEAAYLAADSEAQARAADVLTEHASAAVIEVWCGDRVIHRLWRRPSADAPELQRSF